MQMPCKKDERIELEEGIFSVDEVSEGLHIEQILHRAHQIHRSHGGLIGYDLEDWLQAERESIAEISQPMSRPKEWTSEQRLLEMRAPSFRGGGI
jgi:hypothetical protein